MLLVPVCSGCTIPELKHPLVKPEDAKTCLQLYGVYRSTDCPDNIVVYEHVGPAGDDFPEGFLRFISVSQPKDYKTPLKSESYIGFVEQIGKDYILQIPVHKQAEKFEQQGTAWGGKWDAEQVAGYIVVRLSIREGVVEMSALNNEFVEESIETKQLAGQVMQEKVKREDGSVEIGEKTIYIAAETAELRKFFARHIDGGLFDKPDWKYTRVK
jgi:hypothetical protein